jgi:hypothetical protein
MKVTLGSNTLAYYTVIVSYGSEIFTSAATKLSYLGSTSRGLKEFSGFKNWVPPSFGQIPFLRQTFGRRTHG